MTKIEGKVRISKRNKRTNEVTYLGEHKNVISEWLYYNIIDSIRTDTAFAYGVLGGDIRLSAFSHSTEIPKGKHLGINAVANTGFLDNHQVTGLLASGHDDGRPNNGLTKMVGTPSSYTLYNVIDGPGPGESRTVQTIGFESAVRSTSRLYAAVKLDDSIEQLNDEELTVEYTLSLVLQTGAQPQTYYDRKRAENMFLSMVSESRIQAGYLYGSALPLHQLPDDYASLSNLSSVGSTTLLEILHEWCAVRYKWEPAKGTPLGRVIHSLGNTSAEDGNVLSAFEYNLNGLKQQGTFYHSATSNAAPFFMESRYKTGSGNIIFSGNSWDDTWPTMYRVLFTKSGVLGTATYKFLKTRHVSFDGDSYASKAEQIPYLKHEGEASYSSQYDDHKCILRLSIDKVATWSSDGVTIQNIYDGTHIDLHTVQTTAPVVTVTFGNIVQVASNAQCSGWTTTTDATKLWIADSSLGLFEVNLTQTPVTISRLSSSACRGVDFCYNEVAIAYFSDASPRLALSSSPGTALASTSSVTQLSSATIRYVKSDPSSDAYNTAIVYSTVSNSVTTYSLLWWKSGTGNGTFTAYTGNTFLNDDPAFLECSDTGQWVGSSAESGIGVNILSFGANTTTLVQSGDVSVAALAAIPTTCVVGDNIIVVHSQTNTYGLYNIPGSSITLDRGTLSATNFQWRTSNNVRGCYLGGSLFLYQDYVSGRAATQQTRWSVDHLNNFGNSDGFWEIFGWDGSDWVKNEADSKVVHDTEAVLIDNVSVQFTSGVFVLDEKAQVSYCNGVLIDDGVTHYFEYFWFGRPRINAAALGTIPASSPYEVYLPKAPNGSDPDSDWFKLYTLADIGNRFVINGVAVSSVHYDGSAPSAGEVTVDKAGKMTFNSADAGRSFTASYFYMPF